MITPELAELRAAALVARFWTLEQASRDGMPGAAFLGDAFMSVQSFRCYVITRIERIRACLQRELAAAMRTSSDVGRTILQGIAVSNAAHGIAALVNDERVVEALDAGTKAPSPRFATGCKILRLALLELCLEWAALQAATQAASAGMPQNDAGIRSKLVSPEEGDGMGL